jgi:hypothetical protein
MVGGRAMIRIEAIKDRSTWWWPKNTTVAILVLSQEEEQEWDAADDALRTALAAIKGEETSGDG